MDNTFSLSMIAVFIIGYFLIVFEHVIDINKASSALLTGVLCWVIQFTNQKFNLDENTNHLYLHLSNISQVIIFLVGAMIIVEAINIHKGFSFITKNIKLSSQRKLLWAIGFLTFFLSSVLDNLTTTIVMLSISQKIIENPQDRLIFGGGIVIAANAGGAWTPVGDVTTTMLWIGGQISTLKVMTKLFLPSLACFVAAFLVLSSQLKKEIVDVAVINEEKEPLGFTLFLLGLAVLIFVPIFKLITGLPPFIAIILGLSVIWIFTDITHKSPSRQHLKITQIIPKIDLSGPLFFLGILLSINALETAGILNQLSTYINIKISNPDITAISIGLASSIVDNIPLVAAAMGMYDLTQYPQDANFWQLVAYCAGTGGSILIIGSASGVVYMSMEKVNFSSYLKKISFAALVGYFSGILIYQMI